MKAFFQLTNPEYESDPDFRRHNPVIAYSRWAIPSIVCPECTTWAGSDYIRGTFTEESLKPFTELQCLPVNEWYQAKPRWAQSLGVAESLITPGAQLGCPTGELLAPELPDFIHLWVGPVWIKENVRQVLVSEGVTGCRFVPVELDDTKLRQKLKMEPGWAPPVVWEMAIYGKAWRIGRDSTSVTLCEICGRRTFPEPGDLRVDESRWDGSDLFHLDENPNIIIVSERIRALIESAKLPNVVFVAVTGSQ